VGGNVKVDRAEIRHEEVADFSQCVKLVSSIKAQNS
jgi:hypothetical protein